VSIEVQNESDAEVDLERLVRVARHVLDRMGVHALAELSMILVDEERMAELHVQWMDEPGPTDVMAFPMDELDLRGSRGALPGAVADDTQESVLGDVVLCPAVAARQAVDAGHSTADELDLLTTHGVLHLLGFDHAEPEEKQEMFGLQGELLTAWKEAGGTWT
jgi:probable rRNA maturation factor